MPDPNQRHDPKRESKPSTSSRPADRKTASTTPLGKFMVDPRERALGDIPDLIADTSDDVTRGEQPERGDEEPRRDDAQTRDGIERRLRQHPYIDEQRVRIEVESQVIRMGGEVADRRTQLAVEAICTDHGGGRRIEDRLEVRESNEARDAREIDPTDER